MGMGNSSSGQAGVQKNANGRGRRKKTLMAVEYLTDQYIKKRQAEEGKTPGQKKDPKRGEGVRKSERRNFLKKPKRKGPQGAVSMI